MSADGGGMEDVAAAVESPIEAATEGGGLTLDDDDGEMEFVLMLLLFII